MIVTNAAALHVAERHGLAAPRLLGIDRTFGGSRFPVSVETALPGLSTWPVTCRPDLLRSAGEAIARIHRVVVEPQLDLPYRPRPIAVDDFARERREGRMATTDLLRRADEIVVGLAIPAAPSVLVHGDVWPGNTMVAGRAVRALIDWKTAGVGHPGVDLGELRKQVAIAYGAEAPPYVLQGWERTAGTRADHLPFWDATAALNTPTESTGPVEAARRDAFLSNAIAQL